MELRELRVAVAVADHGSVSRAATELHQSPSSVSQTLAALEHELGARLFNRVARGMVPTDVGRAVLDRARRVLREAEATRAAAATTDGHLAGNVDLAFPASTVQWVTEHVSAFHAEHPDVSFTLHPEIDTTIPELLRRGACDVGIMRADHAPQDLDAAPVGRMTPAVAVPLGHPLAGRASLDITDLDHVPLIAPSTRLGHEFEVLCRRADVKPRVVAETDHPEIALALVRAGMGVTIVPAECAAWLAAGEVAVVPLGPEGSLELAIVARCDQPLAAPADAFWRSAVKHHEQA